MEANFWRSSRILLTSAVVMILLAFSWVGCEEPSEGVIGPSSDVSQEGSLAKTQLEVERVMSIQNRHTDALMAKRGVVGTATGLTPDGRIGVLVLTRGDEDLGEFPLRVDGVPLIIKEVGEIRALTHVTNTNPGKFSRPVPIGVSTGNEGECSSGTIGARVKDASSNVYALSNNHVYALENNAPLGSRVLQPGLVDSDPQCTVNSEDVIGTLSDFEPIVFGNNPNTIDAAIALSTSTNLGNATPSDGYGTPKSEILSATVGQAVQKYGRTTNLTKATITGVNATVRVLYSSGTAKFVDQIVVESSTAFIKPGDSGSLLVTDPARNPVGLLFAGNSSGTVAIANRIDLVLNRFGVTIDGEAATTTTGSIGGTVTDASTTLPISGATVTDGTRSATTDANGNYTIPNVPEGTYTVTASASGYNTASQSGVVVTAGQTTTVNFALTPASATLSVSVTTDKASYVHRENVQITVTVTDGTNPVGGAAVHVEITTANGNKLAGDGTTNSSGVASFTYKVNSKRDGIGTYTINATASKAGFQSGSGSTTFQVTS